MKKILAVLFLVVSMVAGCGEGGEEGAKFALDGTDAMAADVVVPAPDTGCPVCDKCPDCSDADCLACPECDEDVVVGEDNPILYDVMGQDVGQPVPDVVVPPEDTVGQTDVPSPEVVPPSEPDVVADANTDVPPTEPPLVIVSTTTLTVSVVETLMDLYVKVEGDPAEVTQFTTVYWWAPEGYKDDELGAYYTIVELPYFFEKMNNGTLNRYFLTLYFPPYIYFNFYDSEGKAVLLVDETTGTPKLGEGVQYNCIDFMPACCLELGYIEF